MNKKTYLVSDGHGDTDVIAADDRVTAAHHYISDGEWGDELVTRVHYVSVANITQHADIAEMIPFKSAEAWEEVERRGIPVYEERIEVEPDEPPCVDGDDLHEWDTPQEVVGPYPAWGSRWSEVCVRCGIYRHGTRATDEAGHTYTQIRYAEADERSLAYIIEK